MPQDSISEYVLGQFSNAKINRTHMENHWERNRAYFLSHPWRGDEWKEGEAQGWRSRAIPGITHQKVIFALGIVIDAVLAGGRIPFMLKPSGWERDRVRTTGPTDPATINHAISAMQNLVQQQFGDCHADEVFIKSVLSAAIYGWTYSKFVIFNMKREGFAPVQPEAPGILDWKRLPENMQQWQKWQENFMAPGLINCSIWDIYRDWENENIRENAFMLYRQITNKHWIRSKKGKAYFIDENIDKALAFGVSSGDRSSPSVDNNPETQNLTPALRAVQLRVNDMQYLEYWGRIPRQIIEGFEKERQDTKENLTLATSDEGDEVECCVCVTGNSTVRFVRTDPDMRPFFEAKWEDKGDELMPRGIADNCYQMHRVLTGTFRAIEDNEKLSANVIIATKERYFKNKLESIVPGMRLLLSEDCTDARMAIQSVKVESVTGPLMLLLKTLVQFLDDDSMIPKIDQGVREPGDQTLGEAAMRKQASSKYLGMVIKNLDSGLIERWVEEFYKHDMNDPEIQAGKGNYIVQALGFTSFLDRTERRHTLIQILQLALANPKIEAETKIRFYLEELVKALDGDPDQGLKTPEEKQADMEKQLQQPVVALDLAQKKADVQKTEAETLKDKAVGVKNLADAKEKIGTGEAKKLKDKAGAVASLAGAREDMGLHREPSEPEGDQNGLPGDAGQSGAGGAAVPS